MTQTIPVTEARKRLLDLVDLVEKQDLRVDLTKRGRLKAVLVSPEYLESVEETAEILAIPGALESIKRGLKQMKKGQGIPLEKLLKKK